MIDLKPAANPLDVPSPKPSEIVRNWPEGMWGKLNPRTKSFNGGIRFCAIGILAETGGFDWSKERDHPDAPYDWVRDEYNLGEDGIATLWQANDFDGKDAAANLLESWGM